MTTQNRQKSNAKKNKKNTQKNFTFIFTDENRFWSKVPLDLPYLTEYESQASQAWMDMAASLQIGVSRSSLSLIHVHLNMYETQKCF